VEGTSESSVFLKTGPVVLDVLVPGYFASRVSRGMEIVMPVYLHLQMEGNRLVPILVGFPDEKDREFFSRFISVSGIGVKAAIRALERPPDRIASAIASGDCDYLTTLPGIGAKRARQIVAGLQDRMDDLYGPVADGGNVGVENEARAVLKQLGLSLVEADRLVREATDGLEDGASTSEIVKAAMKLRSGR